MIQVHFLGRQVVEIAHSASSKTDYSHVSCSFLPIQIADAKFRTQVPWLSYQHHKHLFHDKKANQVTPAVSARTDVGGVDWLSLNMFDP